jgi:hypothetical protein
LSRGNNVKHGLNIQFKLVSHTAEEIHPTSSPLSTSLITFETDPNYCFWKRECQWESESATMAHLYGALFTTDSSKPWTWTCTID